MDVVIENPDESFEKWRMFGNFMEVALVEGAAKRGIFVDQVFAVAVAVDPAGDRYFGCIERNFSVLVVEMKDHFGESWKPCLSVWINDHTVIKHRMRGGIHAVHNNLLWSGKNIVTGHLHSLKVVPLSDYNDTRFGVDTGCIADRDAAAFRYLEDNPTNWRSGFAVLTFRDGRLMWPELVHVIGEGEVEFRSEVISV